MLSRWRTEYREGQIVTNGRKKAPGLKGSKGELDKIKQLEKQNAELKQENALLKKWQRFLAEEHHSDTSLSRETAKTSK
jgi:transposase